MIKKIVLGLVAVILVLVVVIALQSPDFHVTRSATIPASPAALYAQVNDFHHWNDWSPWAKLDPAARNTFSGAAAGKDAQFHWEGNKEVGKGGMTIVESRPNELVRIRLEFMEPFPATNTSEFTFKPEGDQTVVTWSMYGRKNFAAKAFGLVMDCDKIVGSQFEKGLENLKAVTATKPSP